jgi:phage-related tail fiber protein
MSDRKISELQFLEVSGIEDEDLLPVVSISNPIISQRNKKLRIGDLYTYVSDKFETENALLFLARGFNTTQEGYFDRVYTNYLQANNEGNIVIDPSTSLSVRNIISDDDLTITGGPGSKDVNIESLGNGSIALKNTNATGKIKLQPGNQGLCLFNSTQTYYVDFNVESLSDNYRLNFANGTTTLVPGTMVPNTRSIQITTGNGITGGATALDLSANREWIFGLSGQALAFHSLNSNGFVARTGVDQAQSRSFEVSGTGLSISNGNGVDGNPVISINSTDANVNGTVVSRNLLGNFSANTITATLDGNASTATALQTSRTISLTGDISGTSDPFNGSANVSFNTSLSNTGVSAGTYTKLTVDVKGRVTAANTLSDSDIPSLTAAKITDFDTQVRLNRLDQLALPTSSVSLNNQRITGVAAPVSSTDAVNKQYVDSSAQGLIVKDAVVAATTGNITLSGLQTIDGVTLSADNRVLVKEQTVKSTNGIYLAKSGVWIRSTDADQDAEIQTGLFVFVENGTVNGSSGWVLTTPDPIDLDVDDLTFNKFSGAGQIEGGNGLTKIGNILNVETASASRIVVNADSIDLAATGTPGTYRSVTVDAYGRVTSGTTPTTLAGYEIIDAAAIDHIHGNIANNGAIGTTANLPIITGVSGVLNVGSFGTTAHTFCEGNDSRLSDARTPLAHVHGQITNDGKIGTTQNLPIITGSGGLLTTGSFGTTSNTFCQGNDSRLSDARTPLSHTHGQITNDGRIGTTASRPVITTTGGTLTTGLFGTGAGQFCEGNDSRLSDSRITTNVVTFNSSGGASPGTSFNGSAAITVSSSTVGALASTACTFPGDALDGGNINTRKESGFYQTSSATTANGWPTTTSGYYLMLSCTHNNNTNYEALQIAAPHTSQTFYIRQTANSGGTTSTQSWSRLVVNSGTWDISITGNAATATSAGELTTARTISLGGDLTGSVSFDGSTNVTLTGTVVDNSHNHTTATISDILSGTYTPTISGATNCTVSAYSTMYQRIGNICYVYGSVMIQATATGQFSFNLSCPIARGSVFINNTNASGQGNDQWDSLFVRINAVTTATQTVLATGNASTTNARTLNYSFMYIL